MCLSMNCHYIAYEVELEKILFTCKTVERMHDDLTALRLKYIQCNKAANRGGIIVGSRLGSLQSQLMSLLPLTLYLLLHTCIYLYILRIKKCDRISSVGKTMENDLLQRNLNKLKNEDNEAIIFFAQKAFLSEQ